MGERRHGRGACRGMEGMDLAAAATGARTVGWRVRSGLRGGPTVTTGAECVTVSMRIASASRLSLLFANVSAKAYDPQ